MKLKSVFLITTLLFIPQLYAQRTDTSSFFPLGLWGNWPDRSYAPYTNAISNTTGWTNEFNNWKNTNANFLVFIIPYWDEDTIINFCDQNNFKMNIENFDQWYYGGSGNSNIFSASLFNWIGESYYDTTVTWYAQEAINAITAMKNHWQNHSAFYSYSFNEEHLDDISRWPKVEFLSRHIHQIDPQRKAYYVSGGAPPVGFIDVVPDLDILQMDVYEFYDNTPSSLSGQQTVISNILYHYNTIMSQLINSTTNQHTEWHAIIQAHRENRYNAASLRRPNIYELRVQAYLALSRGARGITSFVYGSYLNVPNSNNQGNTTSYYGIVDNNRQGYTSSTDPDGIPGFSNLATVYAELKLLGPTIRKLNVTNAFANTNIPSNNTASISSVSGNSIEIGTFKRNDQGNNPANYFMLVNRICNNQDGSVSSPQAVTISFNNSTSWEISDIASGNIWIIPANGSFTDNLNPGSGKLYKISPATWSGTKNIVSTTIVASGATLTISSNSSVYFANGASLIVNGVLTAQSATFTSTGSTSPGAWGSIQFSGSGASNSSMDGCTIQYGTQIDVLNGANNVWISNCSITNNSGHGINVSSSNNFHAGGNTITNGNTNYGILISGGSGNWCYGNKIYKYPGSSGYQKGVGIQYGGSTSGIVSRNDVDYFAWGLAVINGSSINYYNWSYEGLNRITNCGFGVNVYQNSWCDLGRTIGGMDDGCGENSIYKNNYCVNVGNNFGEQNTVFTDDNWWGSNPQFNVWPFANNFSNSNWLTSDPWSSTPLPLVTVQTATTGIAINHPMAKMSGSNDQAQPASVSSEIQDSLSIGAKYKGKNKDAVSYLKSYINNHPDNYAGYVVMNNFADSSTIPDIIEFFKANHPKAPKIQKLLLENLYQMQGRPDLAKATNTEIINANKNTEIAEEAKLRNYYISLYTENDPQAAATLLTDILRTPKLSTDMELDRAKTALKTYVDPKTGKMPYASANIQTGDTSSSSKSIVPSSVALVGNYPNPFNPTTQIQYQLPASARVTLKIFDVLGREVAVLVDGMKSAGLYTANFDGSRLASGMYFARMVVSPSDGSKQIVQVKKMLMLK